MNELPKPMDMTKPLIFLLIAFFFYGFIEQSWGQNIPDQLKSGIEQQVDSVFHRMIKEAEHLEFDQLSQGVNDKYNAGFIVNGSYFAQYDSLITSVKARSQGISNQSITIRKQKIAVLSDRIVLLSAYGDTKAETKDGNAFSIRFFWSFVYEKTGNAWKVIQSHQSSIR